MKDEEMAEEWVKQEYPTLQITKVARRYIKAFLAGLKAGRPQWHDLRKTPNDLPKAEEGLVLVVSKNGEPDLSCISTDKRWFCTDYYTGEYKVIAWCEIPTFDKE